MLGLYKLIYDEFIPNTTAVFTSAELYDELGLHDQLAFCAVADGATGANTLTVDLQHSADRLWWLAETASILSGAIAASAENYFFGTSSDNATQQGLAYRRLKIQLSVASPVHVKIYAVAHDESFRQSAALARGR